MNNNVLDSFRAACLSFPESVEKEAWGTPTFRVRDKMFAMWVDDRDDDARFAMWCKAPGGVQEILVGAAPERFFVPPYVGHKGWIGLRLDVDVDWDEVRDLLTDSYLMTAPKKVAAQLAAVAAASNSAPAKPPKTTAKTTTRTGGRRK